LLRRITQRPTPEFTSRALSQGKETERARACHQMWCSPPRFAAYLVTSSDNLRRQQKLPTLRLHRTCTIAMIESQP
ncbi:hypothetical protein M758_10G064400, partial [Ceratodon purpureus]